MALAHAQRAAIRSCSRLKSPDEATAPAIRRLNWLMPRYGRRAFALLNLMLRLKS